MCIRDRIAYLRIVAPQLLFYIISISVAGWASVVWDSSREKKQKKQCVTLRQSVCGLRLREASVEALVRWATGKRLTNRLPKLSLITLSPPSEQRDSWSSYGDVRAGRTCLLRSSLQSLGTQGE